ncbi:p-aminobenzoic acid synthase [Besnoitia besnoiti]|uniref:aminodeoxychorismate synthase n=1 Tax=Besnoitia besnoiti TaxID=94643 RepID=A0A2A9MG07_BESBE|nr:p-aminobenzoic acid synthase [Besnoitia besnoiti]PFH34593.1 p-aminobenzoic acid synthase [Besnoitia besnoiti]
MCGRHNGTEDLQQPSNAMETRHTSESSPVVRTLLIDNHDSYTFNVYQYLSVINGVAPTVIRNDEFSSWASAKASVGPVHNIVISPGPGTVENDHDFGVCREVLKEAAVPVLGICLGHQGLGHTYGGKIQRIPQAVHGRRSPIAFIAGYELFNGVDSGTHVVRYHSLAVDRESLPPCLEPTCWTTDGDNVLMGLRHRELPLHGVQFHPESIGTSAGFRILENFRDMTLSWWRAKGSRWSSREPEISVLQAAPIPPRHSNYRALVPSVDSYWSINVAAVDIWQQGYPQGDHTVEPAVDYFRLFSDVFGLDPFCFWLDSSSADIACAGEQARRSYSGRACFSFMGSASGPLGEVVRYSLDEGVVISHLHPTGVCHHSVKGDIFSFLRARLSTFGIAKNSYAPRTTVRRWKASTTAGTECAPDSHEPQVILHEINGPSEPWTPGSIPFPFPCGYAGFFGYELRHETGRYMGPDMQESSVRTSVARQCSGVPDAGWVFSDRLVAINHETNQLFLSWLAPTVRREKSFPSAGAADSGGVCPCDPWIFGGDMERAAAICQAQQKWAERVLQAIASAVYFTGARTTPSTRPIQHPGVTSTSTANLAFSPLGQGSPCSGEDAPLPCVPMTEKESELLRSMVSGTFTSSAHPPAEHAVSTGEMTTAPGNKQSSVTLAFRDKPDTYKKKIRKIQEYIAAGETYEVCLTTELLGTMKLTKLPPLQFYGQLRRRNPAPFAAFLRFDEHPSLQASGSRGLESTSSKQPVSQRLRAPFSVCCSSPEQFLMKDAAGWLETKPIKGTRPRGKTPAQDRELANDLATNEKDLVENLMIVDLLRNDLGRVCVPGTVSVPQLMVVESYATVHQLVSTIQGKLREPEMDFFDAVIAAFPGGSMTGAPKERAMEIIEQLEARPRGIYSGAIGFLSITGEASLNIVIRTVVFSEPDRISVGAGGAIVALSVPSEEWAEMELKANSVLGTLAACVQASSPPSLA